jgi:multidrug efflux pump subunit AcrA (membrane-fusion protein)
MRISRLVIPIILASGGLLAACGESPKPAPAQRSIAARVITAQYQSVPAWVDAPGSVQPRNRIVLSSQINGFVRTVRVKAGDSVKAGQVLATLDAREADSQKDAAQASIQEAQAALEEAGKGALMATSMRAAAKSASELADSTFARYQKLFDAKSVSAQELDEARGRRDGAAADLATKETMVAAAADRLKQVQARIEQARAQSRRADVAVGWTVIQAPAAGRIAERSADPGSAIFPGGPLLVLETTANPQVLAEIPAEHLSALRQGLEVRVRLSEQGPPVTGRVAEIVPLSNPATHTVQFKVDLPAGVVPSPGAFARVSVPAGDRRALLVPLKAVRETGQLTGVFVVDSGSKARFRLVRTAPYDAEQFELLSGVEQGEKVVSPISDDLADGITLEARS